jgi:hypothetical protein
MKDCHEEATSVDRQCFTTDRNKFSIGLQQPVGDWREDGMQGIELEVPSVEGVRRVSRHKLAEGGEVSLVQAFALLGVLCPAISASVYLDDGRFPAGYFFS